MKYTTCPKCKKKGYYSAKLEGYTRKFNIKVCKYCKYKGK